MVTRGGNLFGAKEVKFADWIKVEDVENKTAVQSLCITLDKGESEAIVLAKEKNALLVMDDGEGRRIAESLELKITGTIGLILLAAENDKLDLKKIIDELMAVVLDLAKKNMKRLSVRR